MEFVKLYSTMLESSIWEEDQATQTASRSDVDVIVGQAAAKIGQILEDYPDAPDQVVVGYLLGQGNNLRHYRR